MATAKKTSTTNKRKPVTVAGVKVGKYRTHSLWLRVPRDFADNLKAIGFTHFIPVVRNEGLASLQLLKSRVEGSRKIQYKKPENGGYAVFQIGEKSFPAIVDQLVPGGETRMTPVAAYWYDPSDTLVIMDPAETGPVDRD